MTVWILTKTTQHAESDTVDIIKIFDSKEKAKEYLSNIYSDNDWRVSYDYEEYEVE